METQENAEEEEGRATATNGAEELKFESGVGTESAEGIWTTDTEAANPNCSPASHWFAWQLAHVSWQPEEVSTLDVTLRFISMGRRRSSERTKSLVIESWRSCDADEV